MNARRVLTILLALAACLAFACARKPAQAPEPGPEEVWKALRARYAPRPDAARSFLADGVMHYQGKRVSGRTTFVFMGDLPGAVRLELSSGFGQTVAVVREAPGERLAYFPDEATAYLDPDADRGLEALGLPIPFPLRDLARVLGGEMAALLPEAYAFADETPDGCVYGFASGPISVLETDRLGRPLALEGREAGGWRLDMGRYPEADEPTPWVPRQFVVEWGKKKATLRITTLTLKVGSWPPGRLLLNLPRGTTTVLTRPLPKTTDAPGPGGR